MFFPSISQDGSRIVFVSNDTHLDPNANGLFQVYLIERQSKKLTMLSVDDAGAPGNGHSTRAEISHDGKWAAYSSKSTNLKGASLASNFDKFQIFLINLETGQHILVSKGFNDVVGNGDSDGVDISADGRQIVFYSEANNLISQDKNKSADVLLFDRDSGTLEQISVSSDGKRISGSHELLGNALSADGNLVMFRSLLGSFDKFRIEVYVRDRKNSRTYLSSFSNACSFGEQGGASHSGSIAPDAPVLTFAVGKDTRSSALQLLRVGLDVLQNISAAPLKLDNIDVDICRDTATLAMTPFSLVSSQIAAAMLKERSEINYETQIKKNGRKSEIKKYTSKRNILSLKNLSPGSYSATYRVNVAGSAGKSRSKFSEPTKFKIN